MLYSKIYNTIKKHVLIPEGSTVIAALSGGADSVCLTEVLSKLRDDIGFTLECAHVNHNLRGDESDGDEQYVRGLCEAMNIPLHVKSVDVQAMAQGRSLEDAARDARYGFFEELSAKKNVIIATAHTLNDNAETFFINLLRGSGSRGLCGIPIKRGNIIRPLLYTKREEITEHLKKAGLSYRTDSTNSDTVFLRNFIRHNVIPQFSGRDGADIFKAVLRATDNLRRDNEALESIASTVTDNKADTLKALPDAVLFRVITARLENKFDITPDGAMFERIKSVINTPSSRQQLRANVFARNRGGRLEFVELHKKSDTVVVLTDGDNAFGEKTILIKKPIEIYNTLTKASVNCDKITKTLVARTRRDGDRFISNKRKCTSNLKKLLINDKVPPELRDSIVVVCDGDNIVFVEGYGVSAEYAAKKDDKNTVCIEIRRDQNAE